MTSVGRTPSMAARGEAVDRALDRAGGARLIPGNRVTLMQDGPAVYDVMLRLIAEAREWIHFENYIIRDDSTGQRFATALAARARAGVRVRVLYDWLGCISTSRRFWRELRAAGVEVRCFNPPHLLRLVGNLSRDHRKMVATDGNRAVIGGLCIGNEWSGDAAKGLTPWRDTAVEIAGPAARALDDSFGVVWRTLGSPVPDSNRASDVEACGDAEVRVIAGEPGRERAYRVLEYLAAGCLERLWVTDAYLVPPPRLFTVLVEAARDGVDIRLLVPGTSDVPFVRNLTRIGYRELLRAGIRIFEWGGPMLHAKTVVSDGKWVRIGSSNLNASSLLGNYELDVVIEDATLAKEMESQYRHDLAVSFEIARKPFRLPNPLGRAVPARLERRTTGENPHLPQRVARGFRGRAAIATRTLISGAWRSIFGPLSLGLVVLAFLFIGLPRAMAYVFGGICVWLSLAAGLSAWRRRVD